MHWAVRRCSSPPSRRRTNELKSYFGTEFGTFCPGVRPAGTAHGDQKRTATPRDAREAGCDYVVVGRPIVEDDDPVNAARAILAELAG
jgi:orotidine-5'-phosphate decarboxylase